MTGLIAGISRNHWTFQWLREIHEWNRDYVYSLGSGSYCNIYEHFSSIADKMGTKSKIFKIILKQIIYMF